MANPKEPLLFQLESWVEAFRDRTRPRPPWRFYEGDGCQMDMAYPGEDDPGKPMLKSQLWVASFDLSGMELRCRKPLALVGSSHKQPKSEVE